MLRTSILHTLKCSQWFLTYYFLQKNKYISPLTCKLWTSGDVALKDFSILIVLIAIIKIPLHWNKSLT